MGLLITVDFNKVKNVATKHGITPKQCYEIWRDVHEATEQVRTENVPLEKLRQVKSSIDEFLLMYDAFKEKQSM